MASHGDSIFGNPFRYVFHIMIYASGIRRKKIADKTLEENSITIRYKLLIVGQKTSIPPFIIYDLKFWFYNCKF